MFVGDPSESLFRDFGDGVVVKPASNLFVDLIAFLAMITTQCIEALRKAEERTRIVGR